MTPNGLKFLAVVLVGSALTGCYLPVRFDAEIEITRAGYYDVIFDGYLVSVPLYQGLREAKISPLEENGKVDAIRRDLIRDSAVKEFKYFKQGYFKVNWRRKGDLLRTKMVTFLRRNATILILKYVKTTGLITVQTAPIAKANARRLRESGLDTQGQLRVKTDARVVDHNAGRMVDGPQRGQKIYVWDVKSLLDPPPKIVLAPR